MGRVVMLPPPPLVESEFPPSSHHRNSSSSLPTHHPPRCPSHHPPTPAVATFIRPQRIAATTILSIRPDWYACAMVISRLSDTLSPRCHLHYPLTPRLILFDGFGPQPLLLPFTPVCLTSTPTLNSASATRTRADSSSEYEISNSLLPKTTTPPLNLTVSMSMRL